MGRAFGSLLVANRGEIALRIIRTAERMGLRTVAVYSDADRRAPHVAAAHEAIRLGPAPAAESYLSIEALLAAAHASGAEAIHPGYGFLSERAEFARAVTDAGLVFVGPPASVMDAMGRKDRAREIAVAAGVPVVPSWPVAGDDASAPTAGMELPVLVKAAAGGGGKGMRIVRSAGEYAEALASARREALAAFGDDTILVEKYVESGRHIEVQVLGDAHGNVVHLFERDCSTQRRHQKVLEEAPAPTIDAETRRRVTDAAVALAKQVGYENAGTVEFLLDNTTGETHFLEMNTRLQVEHPVTEAVVTVGGGALDLVELQLRVARGEPLSFAQDDVALRGHAIEARIYAEDAFAGFLPQAGVAEVVRWSTRARNDVALESGQAVTGFYDPMIGKVIVHGPDREAARRMLVDALDDTAILGLTTNLGFVRELVAGDAFRDAVIDTAWLDRNPDAIQPADRREAAVFAAWSVADHEIGQQPTHPFGTADGWRLTGPAAPATIVLEIDGEPTRWTVSWKRVVGPYGELPTRLVAREPGRLRLEIDGVIRDAAVRVDHQRVEVVYRGTTLTFVRPDVFGDRAVAVGDGILVAPMPGTVLAVDVTAGDPVVRGQRLGVLEAMKMELALTAPLDGTVTRVGASVGDQVQLKQLLFEVEAADG